MIRRLVDHVSAGIDQSTESPSTSGFANDKLGIRPADSGPSKVIRDRTVTARRLAVAVVAVLRWGWAATVTITRTALRIARWALRMLWAVVKWAGRVTLWVVFWPLGLWRSWRHGRDKDMARLEQKLRGPR